MKIGNFPIGDGRTFIIAEAGINHNGELDLAKELVSKAKDVGADAVKFQSFKAEWLCDKGLLETKEVADVTGGSQSSYDMYKALELSDADHKELFQFARKLGILCFSSAFDPRTVAFLQTLDVPAIKIASGDLTYTTLLEAAFATNVPVILSTGMATFAEVMDCYQRFDSFKEQGILLHCISEYPTPPASVNLRVIPEFINRFDCPIGFSDHSLGSAQSIAAVALGGCVIEKHFTLDQSMPGPDQKLSMDVPDFKKMVEEIRAVEEGLGSSQKAPTPKEQAGRTDGRRGLKAARALQKGETLKAEDILVIKPATGLAPVHFSTILGKTVRLDISRGEPLSQEHFN